MPGIVIAFFVSLGLFLLFPKGFKFMVGTWVGVMAGGFFWGVFALMFPALITAMAFAMFLLAGVIVGWIFACYG